MEVKDLIVFVLNLDLVSFSFGLDIDLALIPLILGLDLIMASLGLGLDNGGLSISQNINKFVV